MALKEPMSLEAFLDWEGRQELKYEFDGFQPVAMTGVTVAHSVIQANLVTLLVNRLRGHDSNIPLSEVYEGVPLAPENDAAVSGA